MANLRAAHISQALSKCADLIPDNREDLRLGVKQLLDLLTADGNVRKTTERAQWQSDRLADSMFKLSSPGLVSKVTALAGIAELAGISSNEGMMMKALTQHLKQMEEKLNAMNQTQQAEMNKAIERQQAAMDAQVAEQKALYEKKVYELQNDPKLCASEKSNAALALELEELKANQAALMQEYNKVLFGRNRNLNCL